VAIGVGGGAGAGLVVGDSKVEMGHERKRLQFVVRCLLSLIVKTPYVLNDVERLARLLLVSTPSY